MNPHSATDGGELDRLASQRLQELAASHLRRSLITTDPVAHDPRKLVRRGTAATAVIDFSSNDYLGLASDPAISAALSAAIASDGAGASASRLISGTQTAHRDAEAALARFFEKPAALLFPSGTQANLATIGALAEICPHIISDRLNHASIIDACRLTRVPVTVVDHLDLAQLERALASAEPGVLPLVVVEGLFSMDGTAWNLSALAALKGRYPFVLMVDEAHSAFAVGPGGRGVAAMQGALGSVDCLVATFGKALGLWGASVAASQPVIDLITNRGRAFVFTTGVSPALARTVASALQPESPLALLVRERADHLAARVAFFRGRLAELGVATLGASFSPIVPIVIGPAESALAAGAELLERGFFVLPIRPPTVPAGTSRLRISLSALHRDDDLAALALAVRDIVAPLRLRADEKKH